MPREFSGRLLHELPLIETAWGEVYMELYLDDPKPENHADYTDTELASWKILRYSTCFSVCLGASGCLQGIVDAPFLTLTPGTRTGILPDERYEAFAACSGTDREIVGRSHRGAEARR